VSDVSLESSHLTWGDGTWGDDYLRKELSVKLKKRAKFGCCKIYAVKWVKLSGVCIYIEFK